MDNDPLPICHLCDSPGGDMLVETVTELVRQFAIFDYECDEIMGSGGISALADAMRLLARLGKMEIVGDNGNRRVRARWVNNAS